jgi:hypothetical protein
MADFNVTRFIIDGKTFAIPSAAANQNGLMSASDYSKLAGIETGAQVNKLEGVNVNGVAASIASKIIEVATGSANGTISVQDVDVVVKGLAALAYKAQVSKSDLDQALQTAIDDNTTAIETLNGTGVGSVKKQIDDAFNDFATKVTDDGVVNSYKELIDWAASHGSDATEMAASIQALENLLTGIGGEGEPATVNAAIEKKVDKVEGYGLSKNDFTDDLKAKLDSIDEGSKKVTYSYDSATETLTIAGITAAV